MLSLVMLLFSSLVRADSICGPTMQTIWQLDLSSQSMNLISMQKHQEQYCSPAESSYFNAQLNLLSSKKEIIFSQPVFYQDRIYFDERDNRGFSDSKKITLQIKFPQIERFKEVKTIELIDRQRELLGRGNW